MKFKIRRDHDRDYFKFYLNDHLVFTIHFDDLLNIFGGGAYLDICEMTEGGGSFDVRLYWERAS